MGKGKPHVAPPACSEDLFQTGILIFTAEVQHPPFKLELSQRAAAPCSAGLRPGARQNFPDNSLPNNRNLCLGD